MSYIYRGIMPSKRIKLKDFLDYGIIISWFSRFPQYNSNIHNIRCIFRYKTLLGEIRYCYDGKYAVYIYSSWNTSEQHCLTTESSIQEAKNILYQWFVENEWRTKRTDWQSRYYKLETFQQSLSPFIFR